MSTMERQQSEFSFLEAELPVTPPGRRSDYFPTTSDPALVFDTMDIRGADGCESLRDSPNVSEGAYSQDDFEETEDDVTSPGKPKSSSVHTSVAFVPEDSAGNGLRVKLSQLSPHTPIEAHNSKNLVDKAGSIASSEVSHHHMKPNGWQEGDGPVQPMADIHTAAPAKPHENRHDRIEPKISDENYSSVNTVDPIDCWRYC